MKALESPLTKNEKEAKIRAQKRQDKAQKEADIADAIEFEKYVASEIKWLNTKRKDTTECEQLLSELKVLVNALEITSSSELDNYIIFGRYKDAFNKIMEKISRIDDFAFLRMIEELERLLDRFSRMEILTTNSQRLIDQIKILGDKTSMESHIARVRNIFLTRNEIKMSIENFLIKFEQEIKARTGETTVTSSHLNQVHKDLKRIHLSIANHSD